MNGSVTDVSHAGANTTGNVAYAGLVLWISLGAMWISHALLKIMVFTLPGAPKFFESVGIPGVLVYPVVTAELLGGIAVTTGLYGRQASLALIPVMLVAAWVHYPNSWVFTSAGGGWEYPVFLTLSQSSTDWSAMARSL